MGHPPAALSQIACVGEGQSFLQPGKVCGSLQKSQVDMLIAPLFEIAAIMSPSIYSLTAGRVMQKWIPVENVSSLIVEIVVVQRDRHTHESYQTLTRLRLAVQ